MRRSFAGAVFAAGLVLLAGCSAPAGEAGPAPAQPVVKTDLPGLTAPSGDPDLPSLHEARPSAGAAEQVAGPFDSRFELDGLVFDGSAVSGTVRITSDVSDVIDLMVLAGFYDADGRLLGTASFEHHGEGDHAHVGPPNEDEAFSIEVPEELRDTAVSAAVGIPVLVNE